MAKKSNTELAWQVEALERKVSALGDMVVFMAAHLAEVSPDRADVLSLQLRELQQMDHAEWPREFLDLLGKLGSALDGTGLDLESLR